MPYIRLDQIEFSIGTQVLLDKVSLTLDKGERLGLLGRNGAGVAPRALSKNARAEVHQGHALLVSLMTIR